MFVLDSHCDTPSQYLKKADGSGNAAVRGHVSFPKMKQGGVSASFFALYIPKEMNADEGMRHARCMLELTREEVFANYDSARFAISPDEALKNHEKGLVSVFLGLENASPVAEDMSRLEWFYNQGIRYITLCHNADNQVCDSAAEGTTHHGLSAFGRQLVERMNSMGIIIDCAHISDEAFWDVIRYSTKPVVSTHSCCRALASHRRNMTDDMIKALADKGGVIQINFYPVFLSDSYDMASDTGRPSYKAVADHIDHVVKLVGADYVGIGSDFDGIDVTPAGLEDVSKTGVLFDELRLRGYSESDIEKIAGGNFLRVMRLCGVA